MGIGGAPEGVLAAAALSALGGQIQGRFVFVGVIIHYLSHFVNNKILIKTSYSK